jgi:hypothetical protein
MDRFEECRENLVRLAKDPAFARQDRNEATTRLQLIDRILFECLGWSPADCVAEEAHGGAYADYTCSAPRRLLIVEAKREGDYFELHAGADREDYSIPTLIRDNPGLRAAITQVATYCQSRGVPFAAVSNGHQIVAFVAIRQDGPPLEGRALVFPSLDAMVERFSELWNALSKAGIQEKRIESRLIGHLAPEIPPRLSGSITGYPGTKARNHFQTDLKIVSELVLEDIATAPDLESTFLKECYCESGALSEYSLISRDILQARYTALFDSSSPGPSTQPAVIRTGIAPDLLAKSLSRRPILLLGDVGVGKTTFLRHLVNVAAKEQFENAITVHLNLGSQATLALDLRVFVTREITRQLREVHGVDVEDRAFVRGIYHGELLRFARGIYGGLRETDPGKFAEKELDFLEAKLSDPGDHLKHSLEHIEQGRRKQIVFFLDNSDQRDYRTQQEAFLIAQEFAADWPATVFVTLRPETFHLSLRSGGALSGYHPKAFTVAPPRIDRVIEKRLRFGLRLTRGEVGIQALRNVSVQLRTLETIIQVLLGTLERRKEIGELIDNIAAGNVRLALDLVQNFFGSGHVDTEKIIKIFAADGDYFIPLHEFLRAVIYGDSAHYDPTRSYVANLFDVSSADPSEHFILPIALAMLADWTGHGMRNGFVETELFYDRMQGLGFRPEQVDGAMVRGHRHNLLETSARRTPEPGAALPPSLRVTSVGLYHVRRLVNLFTYLDAVIVDMPIFDPSVREHVNDEFNILNRLDRAQTICAYLDKVWQQMPSKKTAFSWPKSSAAIRSDIEWIGKRQNR